MGLSKKYICIKQNDIKDCGAACLATICKQYGLMVPAPTFEKGDETKGLFQRFWGLIKVQHELLVNIFISSILITIMGVVGSFYFKFLLDDILPNNLEGIF